jgi:hypothetical protein
MAALDARMSAVEMRQRVDGLVPPLLAFVEETTNRIRAESTDPAIRRRALQLKIDALPVVYRVAFQTDPLAAALDLWLLSYQMEGCLEAGVGPCDFGPLQPMVVEAAKRQREEELLKAMNVESVGAFDVIGDVSTTVAQLSSRLNLYMGDAARLGRWHAELLAEDLARWPEIARALEDLDRLTDSVGTVAGTLEPENLNALIDRPLELVEKEREIVLADVDRQRVLTLQYVTAEREAVVEALVELVHAERMAMMAQVRQERLETLVEVERIRRDPGRWAPPGGATGLAGPAHRAVEGQRRESVVGGSSS